MRGTADTLCRYRQETDTLTSVRPSQDTLGGIGLEPSEHRDRPVGARRLPHRRFCGTPAQRFEAKVDRSAGLLSCWLWLAKLDKDGYGVIWLSRKKTNYRAARLAYELVHGAMADDLVIRHKCDNRACVNPVHLEPGTQLDNMLDAVARGHLDVGSNLVLGHLSKGTIAATPEGAS